MITKPLIGIAPHILDIKGKSDVIGTYRTYIDAILKAGGIPLVLSPDLKSARTYLKLVDGLLLTGGGDIHPKYFGLRVPKAKLDLSPEERTRFEVNLAKVFLKSQRPILGICLGCQTINIALGGSLIQDLPTEKPGTRDHKNGNHPIHLVRTSRLAILLGKTRLTVNSRHHQAVKSLGKGMNTAAWSADGVIEAIELKRHPFAIGIQWHPEILTKDAASRKIFKEFVKACHRRFFRKGFG